VVAAEENKAVKENYPNSETAKKLVRNNSDAHREE